MDTPVPHNITLHRKSASLELDYGEEGNYQLSAEFLRVHSPSAEVKGHGPGQEVLQTGKKDVRIRAVAAVGNYAIRLDFDDGHNTGLYSWPYLWELCSHQDALWEEYLEKLQAAGARREPLPADTQVITIHPSPQPSPKKR